MDNILSNGPVPGSSSHPRGGRMLNILLFILGGELPRAPFLAGRG